ncbi:hypothetical protein [Streptomyces tagetis]|uniref:Uncharacterized protein n=1 Tax=Streptomyces tagetis TaxID=2820809 RepID=A0A941AZV7_9ACTN|nr:hypothetical protein [Streptomyces sp. RG38]MBQ0825926.1 hypothetical protein [Streptomyces sp. RG38]
MASATGPEKTEAVAATESLGSELAESVRPRGETPPAPAPSVSTARHEGHEIMVTTTYEVVVDGRPVTARLHVDDSGMVSSPGLPYHRFASALDAVRVLVSTYPGDFRGGT